MTDVAMLAIGVKATGVDEGARSLDGLSNAAKRAQAAADGMSSSAARVASSIAGTTGALERQATAADRAAAAMSRQSAIVTKVGGTMNVASHNVGNLAAQFQDIGVTMAMGMSPLQIALQQGTQISAVFGGMGAAGAVRSLGAAFMTVLSPVSLLTIGLVGVIAAVGQYAYEWATSGSKTEAQLKKERDLINDVADKWGSSLTALKAYNEELSRNQEISKIGGAVSAAVESQWAKLRTSAEEKFSNVRVDFGGAMDFDQNENVNRAYYDFIDLQEAIKDGTATVAQAKAVFATLNDMMKTTSDTGIAQMSGALGELLPVIENAELSVNRLNREGLAQETALRFAEALQNTAVPALTALGRELENGKVGADAAFEKMNALALAQTTPPSVFETINKLYEIGSAALDAKSKLDALGGLNEVDTISRVNSMMKVAPTALPGELSIGGTKIDTSFLDAAAEQEKRALATQSQTQIAAAKAAKAGGAAPDAYESALSSMKERTELLVKQTAAQATLNPLVSDYGYAMAKVTTEQELLNAAEKDKKARTPELIAGIEAEAAAYADATVAKNKLTEAQKLATEQMEFAKDATKGFLSTLREGLVAGEGFWKSFGNAAMGVLDKIIDKLETQLVDALFQVGSSGGGGVGGILGGLLGLLGGGGSAFPAAPKVGLFASGTDFAPGGPAIVGERGPELVNLPRGAQVIPNHRIGAVSAANQNVHVSSEVVVSVDDAGKLQAFVARTAQRTVKAGIQQYDKHILPDSLQRVAKQPRARGTSR